MTKLEAVAEAQRRWDTTQPTEWRGAGRAVYMGATVSEVVTDGRRQCFVGYREAWPGCCIGTRWMGEGPTWEDAFLNADYHALVVRVRGRDGDYGHLEARVRAAIQEHGGIREALAAQVTVDPGCDPSLCWCPGLPCAIHNLRGYPRAQA